MIAMTGGSEDTAPGPHTTSRSCEVSTLAARCIVGIGHTSWVLAQRAGMDVMLNPYGEPLTGHFPVRPLRQALGPRDLTGSF